jgi:hypothetical protein
VTFLIILSASLIRNVSLKSKWVVELCCFQRVVSRKGKHSYYISYLDECNDVLRNKYSTLPNTSVSYLQIHVLRARI